MQVEVEWTDNSETIGLVENTGDCETTYVCLEDDGLCWVDMLGDQCFGICLVEPPELELCLSGPFPSPCQLLELVGYWCRYFGIFADELSVEVCEA